MNFQKKITKSQVTVIVVLRILIGWHLLYEGLFKLLHPEWSSMGFLAQSNWILSGFSDWVISNDNVLTIVDAMNTWGLIFIGLGLILGLFTRLASFAGAFLLLLYYAVNPPFIGADVSAGLEGNYLVVNKTLIEAVALLALALFPVSRQFGLDSLLLKKK
jgi:thiosulfate dehydrogenase [quinone] large subunit